MDARADRPVREDVRFDRRELRRACTPRGAILAAQQRIERLHRLLTLTADREGKCQAPRHFRIGPVPKRQRIVALRASRIAARARA